MATDAGWRRYLVNLRFIRRTSWIHVMFCQLQNFRAVFGEELKPEHKRLLDRYFGPRSPAAIGRPLVTPQRFRQTLVDEVLLRLMVVWEVASGRGLLPRQA